MLCSATMILVGLTGGVATGKSTVAKMFKQCGAARHRCRPTGPRCREARQACLAGDRQSSSERPSSILTARSIAVSPWKHRFPQSKTKRRQLERIIHPRVAREQQRLVRRIAQTNPIAVVIYEVPLLFEAGVDKRVDKIIVVTADRETQIARLKKTKRPLPR